MLQVPQIQRQSPWPQKRLLPKAMPKFTVHKMDFGVVVLEGIDN